MLTNFLTLGKLYYRRLEGHHYPPPTLFRLTEKKFQVLIQDILAQNCTRWHILFCSNLLQIFSKSTEVIIYFNTSAKFKQTNLCVHPYTITRMSTSKALLTAITETLYKNYMYLKACNSFWISGTHNTTDLCPVWLAVMFPWNISQLYSSMSSACCPLC